MKSIITFFLCLTAALGWSLPIQSHHAAVARLRVAGGGGGGSTSVTDNFDTYANGSALDAASNWSTTNGTVYIDKPGSDSSVYAGSQGMAYYSGATFSANHRAEITLQTTGTAFDFICIGVRCQAGADTRYWLQSDGTNWYLVHRVGGVQNVLTNSTHTTLSNGDKIALGVTGTGSATRLTAQIYTAGAWSNIAGAVSVDPGVGKYIDGGYPGIGGDGALARGDDFYAFDLP